MTEPQFSKVLAKVLSGEATWKEKKKITQWANMSDENEDFLKLSQKSWDETKTKISVEDSDAVFDDVLDRIETKVQASLRQKVIDLSNRYTGRRFMYLAAAIALLITTTFIYINQLKEETTIATTQLEWVKKVNAKGQKLKILLSDGTSVWLNGESSLSYASPFGAENRQVLLSGEAYFDVAHDYNKPFTVKTGNVSTTALGTSFNVQAYKDGHYIDIDLETGKILVSVNESGKQQQVFVDPGEGIRFNKDSKQMIKSEFDPSHEFGWKEGILSFKDSDFQGVISKLSRWYGVEFVVKNLDKNKKGWDYTARFDNDFLSSILSGMSFTKNFEYSINNNIVTISFK